MRRRWPVIVLTMVLLVAGSGSFVFLYVSKSRTMAADYISSQVNHVRLLIGTLEDQVSATYRTRMRSFLRLQVRKIEQEIAVAFKERQRQTLLDFCLPFLKTFQSENPSFHTFSWILPDNELFLAVHRPEQKSNSLASLRQDVAAANEKLQQVAGYTYCHEHLQFAVVSPVVHKGEHLGVLQFGLHTDFILKALTNKMNLAAAIVIPRDQMGPHAGESEVLIHGGYVLQTDNHDLFDAMRGKVNWQADQQRFSLGDKEYELVKALSLDNYVGLPLAHLYVALDVTGYQNQLYSDIALILVVTVLGVLLMVMLLYYGYGGQLAHYDSEEQVGEESGRAPGASHKRYQAIFNATHSVMLLVDPESGAIIDANQAAVNYYGYERHELLQKGIKDLNILEEDEIERELVRAKEQQKNYFRFKHRLASGQVREVEVFSGPVRLDGTTMLFSIIHDISTQQRLERQLWQARQMDAMGSMAGVIAHDFNNQLTTILGNAELTLQQLGPENPLADSVAQILASSKKAAELVKQVLAFSATPKTNVRAVDMALLLRSILALVRDSLPPGVTINLVSSGPGGTVVADPAKLLQLVRNLTARAVEAMVDEEGIVTISLTRERVEQSDVATLPQVVAGDFVVLAVEDNGIGLDGDGREHLVQAAVLSPDMGSDTEWNVAEASAIVDSLGGFVRLRSSPEQGSCYRVFLPAQEEEDDTAAPVAEEVAGGSEHLLVVDDEETILLLLETIFTRLGYRVTTKATGQEAFAFLQQHQAEIDLLITDQSMPGMTGVELATEVLALQPELPIILCTGYSPEVSEDQARQMGISRYVAKPINRTELAQAVRELLDRAPGRS